MDLTLDTDDVALLRDLLDTTLRDLSYQISDTDNALFKDQLRARRDRLQALCERLGGAPG